VYEVLLESQAEKDLKGLEREVFDRVIREIQSLAQNLARLAAANSRDLAEIGELAWARIACSTRSKTDHKSSVSCAFATEKTSIGNPERRTTRLQGQTPIRTVCRRDGVAPAAITWL